MTEFGKITIASTLSVLTHVGLFTALTLLPGAAPVPASEQAAEENALEVTFEAAPTLDAAAVAALAQAEAIPTQLDPANLKKTEQAPEHPTEIAAHNSQATPPKPAPAAVPPSPDFALIAAEPLPAPTPTPEADEVGMDALGNYGKAVGNAIGLRSEFYRKTQKDLMTVGEVRIRFTIDAKGRRSDVQVLSNSAAPANAAIAIRAVKEAHIPPIPPERLAQLPGGHIKIVYTFTTY
ncbi:MAG: energy transducer TonB [Verrucomicrobia bacterium]|nr:energy transducer TonB [Verrucomicrobiota bacterium]